MDEKIIKKCIEARHKLHQLAELSNDEIQTKIFLMEFLKKNSCLEIHDEGKWFYAVYKSKERGPGIAFRSEIDAVPVAETTDVVYKSLTDGVSHTCGHDGHCASLLSTALHIEQSGADCDVYFLFQHAEEIGAGAKECLKMLEENDIREIYGCHNAPGVQFGKVVMNEKLPIKDVVLNTAVALSTIFAKNDILYILLSKLQKVKIHFLKLFTEIRCKNRILRSRILRLRRVALATLFHSATVR